MLPFAAVTASLERDTYWLWHRGVWQLGLQRFRSNMLWFASTRERNLKQEKEIDLGKTPMIIMLINFCEQRFRMHIQKKY